MSTLKFHYNGIRASDSKLQRCHYSLSGVKGFPEGTITIYAKDYMLFSKAVCAALPVQDDDDQYSDYGAKESIRVTPDQPLYAEVLAAYERALLRECTP